MLALQKPFYTQYEMSWPIHYEDSCGKQIIIFILVHHDKQNIIKLDIKTVDYVFSIKWPAEMKVQLHQAVIRVNKLTISQTKHHESDIHLSDVDLAKPSTKSKIESHDAEKFEIIWN